MEAKRWQYDNLIKQWVAFNSVANQCFDKVKCLDFSAPLLLRLYLAPVFWMAGTQKLMHFSDTAEWFGNSEWGLGLPVPWLMAFLVTFFELTGSVFLLVGFSVRLMSLPLLVIILVAALTVHWRNGWLAIAGATGIFATERTQGAIERLEQARTILQQYGNYDWLTEHGNFVVLNNGIEFAATYFVMLLSLFFIGSGRYVSLDYWLDRKFQNKR